MEGERVRAQQSYEQMIIEGLMLSDKSAAQYGIGQIFEDIIDSVWAAIPTVKRVKLKVPTPDGYQAAVLVWQEICKMQPPADTAYQKLEEHPCHRERALAKKAVLVDVLSAMKMLYREPQVGKMMEGQNELD